MERSIVMHGTSPVREEGARLLAGILHGTGARGVAFGWTDLLGPELLVPVVRVSEPGVRWDASCADTVVVPIDRDGVRSWAIMLRGIAPGDLARIPLLIARATGWFAGAADRDLAALHPAATIGSGGRFIALLDGLRSVGFEIGNAAEVPSYQAAFADEVAGLPESARPAARAVVDAVPDLDRLGPALIRLGTDLDVAGALPAAVSVHAIAYELALHRSDAIGAMEAARWAGRAHRKLTDWSAAFDWYGLSQRIAEREEDHARHARALDGEGNTHRHLGAFPAARRCYEEAWSLALSSGDAGAIAGVAHSMMTVDREAGRHASAARYGWTALQRTTDVEARANLLLNIGTLLREAGAIDSAVAAYEIARSTTSDRETALMADDAVAYCAALRGDIDYDRLHAAARGAARGAPAYLRAQMGYFRGAALHVLGRRRDAVRVLRAVERYAEAARLREWQVKAAELAETPLPRPRPAQAPVELRQGLTELRRELVGVAAPVA